MIIVGENGVGKSTLLKFINNFSYSFEGAIKVEGNIGYLPQSFENFPTRAVFEHFIFESNNSDLIEMMKFKEGMNEKEWESRFNYLGGHQIAKILFKLNLEEKILNRNFQSLSSGEKVKVHLAVLAFKNPNILLLDEPTNHLDEKGLNWLEKFLKNYYGILIMVTHDRYLISQTANYVCELSPETHNLTHFRGNYQNYLQEKEKQYLRLQQIRKQQEKEIKLIRNKLENLHIKQTICKPEMRDNDKIAFNFHGQRSQKSHKRIVSQLKNKKLDLAENLVEVPLLSRRKLEIDFPVKDNFSENISIKLQNLSKSYREKILFKNLFLQIHSGEKLVVKGSNGAGKSALLKIVMGLIRADEGEVFISNQAKLGYLDQEQETINLNQTVVGMIKSNSLSRLNNQEIYDKLKEFGIFYPQELTLSLSQLSIGCRRKAQLVNIIFQEPNILVLDEPTNHIDSLSLEKIENWLIDFSGPILVASHDRYFIQKVCNRELKLD